MSEKCFFLLDHWILYRLQKRINKRWSKHTLIFSLTRLVFLLTWWVGILIAQLRMTIDERLDDCNSIGESDLSTTGYSPSYG